VSPRVARAIRLEPAAPADVPGIAALRSAAADALAAAHGPGPWARHATEAGVRLVMRQGAVHVARERGRIVATLALSRRKPWAIDPAYFTRARVPLHLTCMAVAPGRQRRGVGRRCMQAVAGLARAAGADAVRLDAYDAPAGAGGFYAACGLREVAHLTYRGTPLVYFEWAIEPGPAAR